MSFGKRLKAAREEKGYTQSKLGDLIGYGNSTISEYEKNNNKPNLDIFIQLCKILDQPPNYFLQDDTNIKEKLLTPEDQHILDHYRSLTPHDREIVDHIFNMEEEGTEHARIYRFPVFYQSAAAGVGRFDVSDGYSMENFTIDNLPDEAAFIMEIAGESMYDEKTDYLIHTGSKVLIDPKISKYNLDEKIVIANFQGKIICKRYMVKDTYILFQSDNDAFEKENRKSTDDPNHKVIGIVLGVIEDEKFIPVK